MWEDIKESVSEARDNGEVLGSPLDKYVVARVPVDRLERLLADAEALLACRISLVEIKQLLGSGSGYHISPDKGPEGLGELMRIGDIFERADNALAASAHRPPPATTTGRTHEL